MTPYEKVVIEEAEKWFPDAGELLVWDWSEKTAGRCHPLAVVTAWEDRRILPDQVSRRRPDYLGKVLEKEWRRSDLSGDTIPVLETWADKAGRRVWRVDLSRKTRSVRLAFGRGLLRDAGMPAWDFDWENLIYPEFSKTCVISFDDGRYVYEPTESSLMDGVENLKPDPGEPSYLSILFNKIGYLDLWLHPEGTLIQARIWESLRERRFTHRYAASVYEPVACRIVDGVDVGEESFFPRWRAAEIGLAWLAEPGRFPRSPGVHWHEELQLGGEGRG